MQTVPVLVVFLPIIPVEIIAFCVKPYMFISTEADREYHQTPGSCVHVGSTQCTDFSCSFHCKLRQQERKKDSVNTSFPQVFKDSTKGLLIDVAFAFVVFTLKMQIQ